MRPGDRRVDHHPPQPVTLRPLVHRLEEPLEPSRGDLAAEAVVDRPVTEFRRQVAPRAADPGPTMRTASKNLRSGSTGSASSGERHRWTIGPTTAQTSSEMPYCMAVC